MAVKERIKFLDGLRGLAALLVVIHHLTLAFYPSVINKNPATLHTTQGVESIIYGLPINFIVNANWAVYLFIILSGFSLSYGFFSTGKRINLPKQLFKRYTRLMPPILISNLLIYGLIRWNLTLNQKAAAITLSPWLKEQWPMQADFLTMLWQSLVKVYLTIMPTSETYNSTLWTIPIFFIGGAITYVILFLIGSWPKRYLIYPLLLIMLLPTHYWAFVIGMFLCDVYVTQHDRLTALTRPGISLLSMVGGLYLCSYPSAVSLSLLQGTVYARLPIINLADNYSFYHVVGVVLVLFSILGMKRVRTFLEKPLWLFFGATSYSLYIIHIAVILTLTSGLFVKFYQWLPYFWAVIAAVYLTFPVMLLAAYGLHRITDSLTFRPLIQAMFRQRFSGKGT